MTFVLTADPSGPGGYGRGMDDGSVINSVAIERDTFDKGETGDSIQVAMDRYDVLEDLTAFNPSSVSACTVGANSRGWAGSLTKKIKGLRSCGACGHGGSPRWRWCEMPLSFQNKEEPPALLLIILRITL